MREDSPCSKEIGCLGWRSCGRSPAYQEGLLQLEGSKIPCEESAAGFTPGAQLPHLFKRVLGSRDTWQERGANSIGYHEDKERPLRTRSGATDHWSRSRMGRRNNTNHEAVRTEVGRWRPQGKQQILSPLECC